MRNVMGCILPDDKMGAPLAHITEMLVANEVCFVGEKRARGGLGIEPKSAKKPATVFTGAAPCVTSMQSRDDGCTICGTCCACCVCVLRKQFVTTHTYAGSAATDRMSSEQLNHEVTVPVLDQAAAEVVVVSDPTAHLFQGQKLKLWLPSMHIVNMVLCLFRAQWTLRCNRCVHGRIV